MKKILLSVIMAASFSMFCHAQTPDPNVAMAEKMLAFVRADNADSLYSYMADEVRGMVKPESLKGTLAKVEAMAGKYKGHGAWEVQTVMGTRASSRCCSLRTPNWPCSLYSTMRAACLAYRYCHPKR